MIVRKRAPRGERGSILILSTVGMVIAMIAAGLAIDVGRLAQAARDDQKVADLAALDAARGLPADYENLARLSAARNGFVHDPASGFIVNAIEGVKTNGQCVATVGAGSACVTVTSPHKNAFPFLGGRTSMTRTAMAGGGNAIGTVRVGSSVLSVSGTVPAAQVPIMNKLVSGLIGGTYSTDAVGWKGLTSSTVTFGALTSALAGVTGNGTFNTGTTSEVLNSTFTMGQLLTATANVLNNSGSSSVGTEVTGIKNGINTAATFITVPIKLYDFFDFGSFTLGNKQDVANAKLNVYDLIVGGAILADGDHFASFNLAVGDIVGTVLPGGFSGAKVSMSLIEAPQQSFPGPPGKNAAGVYYTQAHTAQVRIKLEVGLTVPLDNTITIPLVGSITNVSISVPFDLKLGEGHAYLERVNCGSSAVPSSVDIKGATDNGTFRLGTVTDADLKARVANPVLETDDVIGSALAGAVQVKLTGTASTTITGNPGVDLTFYPGADPPYADDHPSQPVPGSGVNLPPVNGKVTATLLGLVNTGLLNDVIEGLDLSGLLFETATPAVNTALVQPLLDALGLSFGTADVWAPQVQSCAALSTLPAPTTAVPVLKG